METLPTRISGPKLISPSVFGDERGFFVETYRREGHAEVSIPADEEFIQDNHSRSTNGVVRGMHFHVGSGVAKLVRCARGRIMDVLVGLRGHARYMVEAAVAAGMAKTDAHFFDDPAQAGDFVRRTARAGDAVLFKGSRGVKMEQALERFLT